MVEVQWWRSAYDNRVHAFGNEEAARDFGEALCEHCVPNSKIECTDEGERCLACMLIFGDLLADNYGEIGWRAS